MLTLESKCSFIWNFGQDFLLQDLATGKYYIWSDPDYNGDNTIKLYTENPNNFTSKGFCGRDKGEHKILDYCGADVKILC